MSQRELPRSIVEADRALHELHLRVSYSRHLNPLNVTEALEAFKAGAEAPPFRYAPATWASEELSRLSQLRVEPGHPFSELLEQAIEYNAVFIHALSERTSESFERLARSRGWLPDAALLEQASVERPGERPPSYGVSVEEMIRALDGALRRRGYEGWRVERDPVMAARVLVDNPKRLIRVNSVARFSREDITRLIAHEIDVHVARGAAGERQQLHLFSNGLPGSLETEEGLAIVAEELSGAANPGDRWRRALVVRSVERARHVGFRELHDWVAEQGGEPLARAIATRLKRGLADPSRPGLFAKDIVYYRGARCIRGLMESGADLSLLFVGKVSTEHPVRSWLDAGLLEAGVLPSLFRSAFSR